MRPCVSALVVLLPSLLSLALLPIAARADGCAKAAQAVADATGARVGERSVGSDVYLRLDHPDAAGLALHCKGPDPRRGPSLFAAAPQPRPAAAFYALVARAASALLQLKPQPVQAAARRCLAGAVRDENESGTVETRELRVECTVNKADGRATLTIGSAMMRPY